MALYAIIKKGDQNPDRVLNPDANQFIKEGMLVCLHDEAVSGPISTFSAHMKKVYVIMKVPESYRAFLENAQNIVWSSTDKLTRTVIRKRGFVMDLQALAQKLGDNSLYTKWGDSTIVEPVDYAGQSDLEAMFQNATLIDYNGKAAVKDNNLITSGVYTVGTAGDYTNFSTFEADIGTPDGLLTGRLISDVSGGLPDAFFNVLSSYGYTLDSDTPHNGDQTAGWTYTDTSASDTITAQYGGGGTFTVKDFQLECTSVNRGNDHLVSPNTASADFELHDMIFNMNGAFGTAMCAIFLSGYTGGDKLYNCLIRGGNSTSSTGVIFSGTCTNTVRNMTLWAQWRGFDCAGKTMHFDNCAVPHAYSSCFYNDASATADNCVAGNATDATCPTGSNNHDGVTFGDEVQSTSWASGTLFMLPKTGGNMTDGGNTNHDSTAGMKGVLWDGSTPSIGAFQWPATVTEHAYPAWKKRRLHNALLAR